jgi:hypothetical protein
MSNLDSNQQISNRYKTQNITPNQIFSVNFCAVQKSLKKELSSIENLLLYHFGRKFLNGIQGRSFESQKVLIRGVINKNREGNQKAHAKRLLKLAGQ